LSREKQGEKEEDKEQEKVCQLPKDFLFRSLATRRPNIIGFNVCNL
jgi:hypothetical protein